MQVRFPQLRHDGRQRHEGGRHRKRVRFDRLFQKPHAGLLQGLIPLPQIARDTGCYYVTPSRRSSRGPGHYVIVVELGWRFAVPAVLAAVLVASVHVRSAELEVAFLGIQLLDEPCDRGEADGDAGRASLFLVALEDVDFSRVLLGNSLLPRDGGVWREPGSEEETGVHESARGVAVRAQRIEL